MAMPDPAASRCRVGPVYHIAPRNDTYAHILDREGSCWCNPQEEFDGEHTCFVHNSYDCREAYEDGRRKPH